MRYLLLAAALALAATPALAEEPPPKAAGPAAAPAAKAPPKDPASALARRIDDALNAIFTGNLAARGQARAALAAAVAEWREAAKDDPLRAAAWWRGALERTLPAGNPKRTGIFEEKVPYVEGKEALLWVSVPKTYSPKNLYPLLLVLVDRSADPRRHWPSQYGELLKEFVVIGFPVDAKAAGYDVVREPWHVGFGLKHAVESFRIDRDRVFLDGPASASTTVAALGAEWAVQFAGLVLRAPRAVSPLSENLGLPAVLVLDLEAPPEGGAAAMAKIRAAAPSVTVQTVADLEPADAGAAQVQAWIKGAPKRTLPSAAEGFTWVANSSGGEMWCYWLWVFRPVESKPGRLVRVALRWDRARNAAVITSENLAEGILLVNDLVLDLDREVAIVVNGREVWKGAVTRGLDTATYWIGQTGERPMFAPGEIRFTVPRDAQAPPAAGDGGDGKPAEGGAVAPAPGGDGETPPTPPQSEEEERGGGGDGGGEGGGDGGGGGEDGESGGGGGG